MEPIQVYVKEGETTALLPKTPTEEVPQPKLTETTPSPFGACPFCHQVLMLLSIKRQILGEKSFHFDVHRVNVAKPPPEFRQNCFRNVPALVDANTETSSDHELEIIEYLEQQYPTPAFTSAQDTEELRVVRISSELFKKFNYFIKNTTKENGQLLQAMAALNDYLEKKGSQFIFSNNVSIFDTELMPKLHQLRIACSYIRSFDIPANMIGIWRYLYRAYHCPAFVQWCPSDQEIVIAWTVKAALETPSMMLSFDEKKRLIKSEPRFTFTMPSEELAKKFSAALTMLKIRE